MPAGSFSAEETDVTSSKSPADKKAYRLLRYIDSGMEVLLIDNSCCYSSAEELAGAKAAGACCVQAGSFADPAAVAEGCAHYVEHMLFMGSEKYPSENEYDAFVSSHGGSDNAFTEGDHTCYQFDIAAADFPHALDIFANCLICPLIPSSSLEREVKAIDSEFKSALNDDGCRREQLFLQSAREGHVVNKFMWGNIESLSSAPKAIGVDIRAVLRAFYAAYYRPSACRVVLLAPKALDETQRDFEQSFSAWLAEPPSIEPSAKHIKVEQPFSAPHFLPLMQLLRDPATGGAPLDGAAAASALTYMVPVKASHVLMAYWLLDPSLHDDGAKSIDYVSHLVGHEGGGSLLSLLKHLGLATALSTSSEDNTMYVKFSVSVTLTLRGVANWTEVLSMVLQYAAMLRSVGPQQWIYEELARIAQLYYDHCDEEESFSLVERLACELMPLKAVPRDGFLSAPFLFREFRPEQIRAVAEALSPDGCRVVLSSPGYRPVGDKGDDDEDDDDDDDDDEDDDDDDDDDEDDDDEEEEGEEEEGGGSPDGCTLEQLTALFAGPPELLPLCRPPAGTPQREPRFDTQHWSLPIPAVLAQRLQRDVSSPHPSLRLPLPNAFIAERFEVLPPPPQPSSAIDDAPSLLCRGDRFNIWHHLDRRFPAPKADLKMAFLSQHASSSAETAAMTQLLAALLKTSLNETLYAASMAELHCSISATDDGVVVSVSGFSDKAVLLLQTVCSALLRPPQYLLEDAFAREAERLETTYTNSLSKAGSAAQHARLALLKPTRHFPGQCLRALQGGAVTLAGLEAFAATFLGSVCADGLFYGNTSADECAAFHAELQRKHAEAFGAASGATYPECHISKIAAAGRPLLHQEEPANKGEQNACVEVYCQVDEFDLALLTRLELLEQLVSEPYFHSLRTTQQLGYSVSCGTKQTFGVLGFGFQVVSASHPTGAVLGAVTTFIDAVPDAIGAMGGGEYGSHLASLAADKLKPPATLFEAAGAAWYEIEGRRLAFNLGLRQAALLRSDPPSFAQDRMRAFAHRCLVSERRALVVQAAVRSRLDAGLPPAQRRAFDEVVDRAAFHSRCDFYRPAGGLPPL